MPVTFIFYIMHLVVNAYCDYVTFAAKVREKLAQLATERGGIMEKWEDHWEYLQLSMFHFLVFHLLLLLLLFNPCRYNPREFKN